MNYEQFFADRISDLRVEGRYRVFADLERQVGAFPKATSHTGNGTEDVTVWCSNDYLGMGQHPDVIAAMRAAAAAGALTALQAVIQHGGTKLPIDGTADDDRCTALHIAAFRGHDDCVAALVSAGASAGARNRLGLAPADLATQEAPQDPACFRE